MERGRDACKGAACIHNLSSSRLKTWPDSWRRAKRAKGVPCTRFYNLVTSTIYYERAYLTGEASSVSINSSSQDINVLYIVRNRFSRGVREGVREGIVKRSRCVIHPRAFPLRFFSFFFFFRAESMNFYFISRNYLFEVFEEIWSNSKVFWK